MLLACKAHPEPGHETLKLSLEVPEVPAGDAPEYIQVLPAGIVHTEKYGDFVVDDEAKRAIIADFAARENDLVIDYEHQTLTGQEAPAAGWIKELVDRGPDGLWARVEWTPRAAAYLANKEYRYFSPVVFKRVSDGRIVRLHSGALTNTPAIDGMVPLVNKSGGVSLPMKEGTGLDQLLEQIRWMLNLPVTATVEEIIAELQKLIDQVKAAEQQMAAKDVTGPRVAPAVLLTDQRRVAAKEILDLLECPETADLTTVKGKILALKNPSGYVRVEEFRALQEKLALKERDELVDLALKQGKIAPAQKDWAEQYALKDPDGFRAFIAQAPQVVPVGQEISAGAGPGSGKGPALDEIQMLVNKQLGISDEVFKMYGGDQ